MSHDAPNTRPTGSTNFPKSCGGSFGVCRRSGAECAMPERRSDAGCHRAHSDQASHRRLAFVVAHKRVDGGKISRRRDVDRIEGSQRGLFQRSGCRKHCAVERQQAKRIEQFFGAFECRLDSSPSFLRKRSPDRPWNLGERELARDKIGIGDESSERRALGLVGDQLHERRRIEVEKRTQCSPRISSRARLSARGSPSSRIGSGRPRRTGRGTRPSAISRSSPVPSRGGGPSSATGRLRSVTIRRSPLSTRRR